MFYVIRFCAVDVFAKITYLKISVGQNQKLAI